MVLQAGRGFCGSGAEALPKYSQSTPRVLPHTSWSLTTNLEYSRSTPGCSSQGYSRPNSMGVGVPPPAGVGAYSQPLKIKTPTKLRECSGTPLAICARAPWTLLWSGTHCNQILIKPVYRQVIYELEAHLWLTNNRPKLPNAYLLHIMSASCPWRAGAHTRYCCMCGAPCCCMATTPETGSRCDA